MRASSFTILRAAATTASAIAIMSATSVGAQEIEDIIVTAQKVEENVQTVPIAIRVEFYSNHKELRIRQLCWNINHSQRFIN